MNSYGWIELFPYISEKTPTPGAKAPSQSSYKGTYQQQMETFQSPNKFP